MISGTITLELDGASADQVAAAVRAALAAYLNIPEHLGTCFLSDGLFQVNIGRNASKAANGAETEACSG